MRFEPIAENYFYDLSNCFDSTVIKMGGLQNKLKGNINIDTNRL